MDTTRVHSRVLGRVRAVYIYTAVHTLCTYIHTAVYTASIWSCTQLVVYSACTRSFCARVHGPYTRRWTRLLYTAVYVYTTVYTTVHTVV